MIRLLVAELKRIFIRRMTVLFPAVLALLFVGGIVIAYFVIEGDPDNSPDFVDDIAGGVEATQLLGPISSLLVLMAFVIGASSIGADAKTGMLEQILTWEPRRLRFLGARLVAAFSAGGVFASILAAFFVALLYGLAAFTGTTDGTSSELWTNVAWIVVRAGVGAGLFCAFGVAVTALVNSSVGSIVSFVVYFFIVENLVSAFLPKVAVYLPVTNAASFVSGADVERAEGNVFSGDFEIVFQHNSTVAGLILCGWVVITTIAASVVFARRDID